MLFIVLGTRPEIIKCAPLVYEAQKRGLPFGIVHTGQHYTPTLDDIFFKELGLPEPLAHLHVGSMHSVRQVATIMERLIPVFEEKKPSVVIVQGDTNSVLAGALAAQKMGIPVAHLEAGLRSDDWTMPEEANRVLTGHIARWHFCPTERQKERLAQEGIVHGVHVVGNSIVDAVLRYAQTAKCEGVWRQGLSVGGYLLLTMHRPSNVDDPVRLERLMACLAAFSEEFRMPILFPVHPRTEACLRKAGLYDRYAYHAAFRLLPPVGYLDLLQMQKSAYAILTDSGGIQEEANILRVPCVTLRENTERPETLAAGGNILFPETDPVALAILVRELVGRPRNWDCPFGAGDTAERVISLLSESSLI